MTESRVKAINAGEAHEEDLDKVANELISVSEVLSQMMNDQNADVRKTVVFCLVEIYQAIGEQLFEIVMQKLSAS